MKKIISILIVLSLLFVVGCTTSIDEVKSEDYIGKTVSVKGEVTNTIKFGELSGYTLEDDTGVSIGISTKELPKEGETITVTGTLMKDTLFGYYVLVN